MADVTRHPEGVWLEGTLTTARPVGALVRNTVDGELYASTDAALPAYTQVTNRRGGGTGDALQRVQFTFSVPDAVPGDVLTIAFSRVGGDASDTYTGNVDVVLIETEQPFWR